MVFRGYLSIIPTGSIIDFIPTGSYEDISQEVSHTKQTKLWLPLDKIVHKNAVIGKIEEGTNKFVRVIANAPAIAADGTSPDEGRNIDQKINQSHFFSRCHIFWKRKFSDHGT